MTEVSIVVSFWSADILVASKSSNDSYYTGIISAWESLFSSLVSASIDDSLEILL